MVTKKADSVEGCDAAQTRKVKKKISCVLRLFGL